MNRYDYIARARFNKVSKLIAALESSVGFAPEESEFVALFLEEMDDAGWNDLARFAGVRMPSVETREQMIKTVRARMRVAS